ncbi:hypothetical protein HAX54_034381 [Datura stramonium]|uniref:Photosystem I reaction center subunit VI n=1 Tax=Datura stramonium TaxID=4076 RepID=A0ABS8SE58_DATST|nr:hypothetical protein [Datura stramonium]
MYSLSRRDDLFRESLSRFPLNPGLVLWLQNMVTRVYTLTWKIWATPLDSGDLYGSDAPSPYNSLQSKFFETFAVFFHKERSVAQVLDIGWWLNSCLLQFNFCIRYPTNSKKAPTSTKA